MHVHGMLEHDLLCFLFSLKTATVDGNASSAQARLRLLLLLLQQVCCIIVKPLLG
jgi:hypothetical protein